MCSALNGTWMTKDPVILLLLAHPCGPAVTPTHLFSPLHLGSCPSLPSPSKPRLRLLLGALPTPLVPPVKVNSLLLLPTHSFLSASPSCCFWDCSQL